MPAALHQKRKSVSASWSDVAGRALRGDAPEHLQHVTTMFLDARTLALGRERAASVRVVLASLHDDDMEQHILVTPEMWNDAADVLRNVEADVAVLMAAHALHQHGMWDSAAARCATPRTLCLGLLRSSARRDVCAMAYVLKHMGPPPPARSTPHDEADVRASMAEVKRWVYDELPAMRCGELDALLSLAAVSSASRLAPQAAAAYVTTRSTLCALLREPASASLAGVDLARLAAAVRHVHYALARVRVDAAVQQRGDAAQVLARDLLQAQDGAVRMARALPLMGSATMADAYVCEKHHLSLQRAAKRLRVLESTDVPEPEPKRLAAEPSAPAPSNSPLMWRAAPRPSSEDEDLAEALAFVSELCAAQ